MTEHKKIKHLDRLIQIRKLRGDIGGDASAPPLFPANPKNPVNPKNGIIPQKVEKK
jgi:hypothetical protein